MSYADYKHARDGAVALKRLVATMSKRALRPSEKKALKSLVASGAIMRQLAEEIKRADRHLAEVFMLLAEALISGAQEQHQAPKPEAKPQPKANDKSKVVIMNPNRYRGTLPTRHI